MTGQRIGYKRVSTIDQNTARQLFEIAIDKSFEDKASGKDTHRPQLQSALEYCRDIALPQADRGEAWHWTLRLMEEPGQVIGAISLTKGDDDNRGFWLGVPWRGRGLMSEACAAVNDFWFDTLGFPVMRIPKAEPNTASRRISQKQGMRVVAQFEKDFVCGRLPAEIWEITADEWRAFKAGKLQPPPTN